MLRTLKVPRNLGIIGAPLSFGQPLAGVDHGPQSLRRGGLTQRLHDDGWKVRDYGDVDLTQFHTMERQKAVGLANEMVYKKTKEMHHEKENQVVLTIGGDHSVAIGSIAGLLDQKQQNETQPGIIWIDAHADINTPKVSNSGNLHGMVLSFLINYDNMKEYSKEFQWLKQVPNMMPKQLVYVGLRDVDKAEKEIIKNLGIKAYTMHDIDKYGIGRVMEMALDHVCGRVNRPLHMSFDIDSVDPTFAPSTGTRVAGGLSYREAYYICEAVAETGSLCSMDMVEVNPRLNPEGAVGTIQLACGLVSSALGNSIL